LLACASYCTEPSNTCRARACLTSGWARSHTHTRLSQSLEHPFKFLYIKVHRSLSLFVFASSSHWVQRPATSCRSSLDHNLPWQSRVVISPVFDGHGEKQLPCPLTGSLSCEEGRALVDEYHAKYIGALKGLYDQHKHKYAKGRRSSFCLVE
jgi:hypothetical protein